MSAAGARPSRMAWYTLAVVTLVAIVNFVDRQIIAVLLPAIKAEFRLSDFELGIMIGPAFAVVYSIMTVVLAVASDRINRRNVVVASVAVFGFMTLLAGFATQTWHLMLSRFGVGAGQGGTSPPITSMLADLFPRNRRATALSIYSAGSNIGMLVSYLMAAWIVTQYGWRMAFIVAGIPGLILAVLILFTVREPVRGSADARTDTSMAPGFLTALRILWSSPTYRYIVLGTAIRTMTGYGIAFFYPTFIVRSHGLPLEYAAIISAILFGLFGAIGTSLGGKAADYFSKYTPRAPMYVTTAIMLICAPFVPPMLLLDNLWLAMAAAVIPMTLNAAYVGPSYAVMQSVAPLRVRSLSAGIFLFTITIIGLSLGPMMAGGLSDMLRPFAGEDSLRYALLMHCPGMLLAGFCFWLGSRTVIADMEKVK